MMQEGRDWDRLVINRKDTTGEERVIGHTQIRKGGIAKVTGTAQYGADVDLPGQLYAAVARSPYPHARILRIDTQEAAVLPGVRAVITGADCPTLFGSFIADQPIVAREKVRYQGEPVAAVAAGADGLEIDGSPRLRGGVRQDLKAGHAHVGMIPQEQQAQRAAEKALEHGA